MRARERTRDDACELAGLPKRVAARDRDEHVNPSRARRLREALKVEEIERLPDQPRNRDHVVESRPLRRVEVEHDPVGALGLVHPRRPHVHVDAAHVDHPEERELVVHERVLDELLLAFPGRCG
jgi:hypothetical protein